ncbi:hypothetical protein ABT033_09230 [Streptomyces pharetrae]|uniref:LysM peptidoglycan-binding domain-containing protein n=1 Tax=Streptomyces pharetrae TaxID=291370 RepID=UPI003360CAF5
MPQIRRRSLALGIVSGLAAGSTLLTTGQAMAMTTHVPERAMVSVMGPDKPQETRKGEPPRPADAAPGASRDRALHETYTVETGDSLWEIADHHYGDGAKWWALYGANHEVLEKKARGHGRKGSEAGHWIFPRTKLAVPEPDVTEANAQAFHEAINRILVQHPQLTGSSLCPGARAPEDIGECFLGLPDLSPLLLDRLDLLEEVSASALLESFEPLVVCVLQGNEPDACPTGAIPNPSAQG